MSAPEAAACRECHRDDQHKLSCSHVRYEKRLTVVPSDEVAAPHEPEQPYCPGPDVECHISPGWLLGFCPTTGGACYYRSEAVD